MSESRFNLANSGHLRLASTLFQNRDVLRAGWLKYIPFAERISSDEHKFWAVFAVYDQTTPYLEFYQKRHVTNNTCPDGPVSKHSLQNCRHVSSVISPNMNHFEFQITLDTHVIRLAAESEEVMFDWIGILKTKLISMSILKPGENLYSKSPLASHNRALPQQPTQPQQRDQSFPTDLDTEPSELYEPIFEVATQQIALGLNRLSLEPPVATVVPPEEEPGPPPYEHIFIQNASNQSNNQRSVVSFREAQVEKLKKEMELLSGLSLKVRRKDCYNTIAFVDILSYGIFIAGWKQNPHLHCTFHIGDQLVSINSVTMESAMHARSFIKHECSSNLEMVVRRVPMGQVFCLKRSHDGEDLGLLRERGTAEIKYIIPNSIAAKAGLLPKCTFYHDAENNIEQNWCLTEINNRPLNLFFKNHEISDRLNAIGKEISILVQPYNFVRRLRKQLKTYKNYKDYIVQ